MQGCKAHSAKRPLDAMAFIGVRYHRMAAQPQTVTAPAQRTSEYEYATHFIEERLLPAMHCKANARQIHLLISDERTLVNCSVDSCPWAVALDCQHHGIPDLHTVPACVVDSRATLAFFSCHLLFQLYSAVCPYMQDASALFAARAATQPAPAHLLKRPPASSSKPSLARPLVLLQMQYKQPLPAPMRCMVKADL